VIVCFRDTGSLVAAHASNCGQVRPESWLLDSRLAGRVHASFPAVRERPLPRGASDGNGSIFPLERPLTGR
jgi:hypothetical protein